MAETETADPYADWESVWVAEQKRPLFWSRFSISRGVNFYDLREVNQETPTLIFRRDGDRIVYGTVPA